MHHEYIGSFPTRVMPERYCSLHVAQVDPVCSIGVAHGVLGVAPDVDAFSAGVPTFVVTARYRIRRDSVSARVTGCKILQLCIHPMHEQLVPVERGFTVDVVASIEYCPYSSFLHFVVEIIKAIQTLILRAKVLIG